MEKRSSSLPRTEKKRQVGRSEEEFCGEEFLGARIFAQSALTVRSKLVTFPLVQSFLREEIQLGR